MSFPSGGADLVGRGLVLPPPGARPLGLYFARYLAATCHSFFSLGELLPEPLRPAFARAAEAVQRAYAEKRRAVLACFASPTVGTAIQTAARRAEMPDFRPRIDAAIAWATPHLLLELALRRLLPDGGSVAWPHVVPHLASLSLGAAFYPPSGSTGLRFASGRIDSVPDGATLALDGDALPHGGGFRVEPAYRRVGRVTRLAALDHNPIAQFEAHPDKAGNAIDLGGRPAEEWARTLDEAFALVETHLPDLFGEMGMMLHEVVPVGYDRERHLSASYREAIGTVYVTLHPNLMTMAEALVHEFQHNKMNVASYSIEVLHNPFHPRYPSPVRPDPRPLWGILLAVHAFLPVAVLYRKMRAASHPRSQTPDFERRLSEIDLKNHEGMEMLRAHADFTPAGRALMDELDLLDRAHMAERVAARLPTEPTQIHEA